MRRTALIALSSGVAFSVITAVVILVTVNGCLEHESALNSTKSSVSAVLQLPHQLLQAKKRMTREVTVEVPCAKKSRNELRDMMGPAFNKHYLSDVRPKDFFMEETKEMESIDPNPFHVGEDFKELIVQEDTSDFSKYNFSRAEFADEILNITAHAQPKRLDDDRMIYRELPWMCKWHIRWVDMGQDTFPRYMRSVTCSEKSCWFDRFTCHPRAFFVPVLKRKNSRCFAMQHLVDEIFPLSRKRYQGKHLPPELQEEWVFEQRAANFCCECVQDLREFPSVKSSHK